MSQQTHHMRLFVDLTLIELDKIDNPDMILYKFKVTSDPNKMNVYMLQNIMSEQDASNKIKIDNSYVSCAKLVLNLNEELASKSCKSLIHKLNETLLHIKPNFPMINSIRVFLDNEYEVSPNEIIKNTLYKNENVTIVGISNPHLTTKNDQIDLNKSLKDVNFATQNHQMEPNEENKYRKESINQPQEVYDINISEKVKDQATTQSKTGYDAQPQVEHVQKAHDTVKPESMLSPVPHYESKKHKHKQQKFVNNTNTGENSHKNSNKKRNKHKNKNKHKQNHQQHHQQVQNKRVQKQLDKANDESVVANSYTNNLFNSQNAILKHEEVKTVNSARKPSFNESAVHSKKDMDNNNSNSSSSMSSISDQEDEADEFKMLWKGVENNKDHGRAGGS